MESKATAQLLLEHLQDAASVSDFKEVLEIFKRMLQPFGYRPMQDTLRAADRFSVDDIDMLRQFWCKLIDIRLEEPNTLLRAMPAVMTMCTAAHERELIHAQNLATSLCEEMDVLCTEMLNTIETVRETPTGNILRAVKG